MNWSTTHSSLLTRIQDQKDDAAWHEFEDLYGELILRFCVSSGVQFSDALDLRQTVLVDLWKASPQFEYSRARGRFRSYLGLVTRRAIGRYFAAQKKRELPGRELPDVGDEQLPELWEQQWMDHHLRRSMRLIRSRFKPIYLTAFEDLLSGRSTAEVARAHSLTPDALRKIKQRVRQALEEEVRRRLRDECNDDS